MEIKINQNKSEDILEVPRKGVHTLSDDISHEAEAGTPGTIRAIIDSEEGKEIEKENVKVGYTVNQLYMIFGFIALVLSAGLIYYFIFFIAKNNTTVNQFPSSVKNIFLVDKTANIELANFSKTKILKIMKDEAEKVSLPEGKIQTFNLLENNQIISLARFLQIIEANISLPEGNIFSHDFMYGVFKSEDNNPFFVFKVKNMKDAFTTLANWENKMLYDLGGIFGYELNSDTQYLLTKDFEDEIVKNKNARVLRDEFGSVVLMYVYIDDTTIVISNSAVIAGEIIERGAQSRVRK